MQNRHHGTDLDRGFPGTRQHRQFHPGSGAAPYHPSRPTAAGVQRLEAWLGVSLFEREARPVALTSAGQEFLARAERLREDILDSRRAVRSLASIYDHTTRLYTTNTLAIGFSGELDGEDRPYQLFADRRLGQRLPRGAAAGARDAGPDPELRNGRGSRPLAARGSGQG